MHKSDIKAIVLVFILLIPLSNVYGDQSFKVLYESQNLNDFKLVAECNPGGGTDCECYDTGEYVSMESKETYAVITSNPEKRHTWVNAIGGITINENFPDGEPVRLGIYKYSGRIRLPEIPDPYSETMPNNAHMGMYFWDGRNELIDINKVSLEAVMLWDLNPWTADMGKFKVYTDPVNLVDTGISVAPDTEWHTYEIVVDFNKREYISVTIDDETKDLSGLRVAHLYRPYWGENVGVVITAESLAAWPFHTCDFSLTWSTHYSDAKLSVLEE